MVFNFIVITVAWLRSRIAASFTGAATTSPVRWTEMTAAPTNKTQRHRLRFPDETVYMVSARLSGGTARKLLTGHPNTFFRNGFN